MGASGWAYFVPYQPDIEQAFHALRQSIFDAGDYFLEEPFIPDTEEEYVAMYAGLYGGGGLDDEEEKRIRETYRMLKERYSKPRPESIDELLEWNAESGTHTIMDLLTFTNDPTSNDLFTVIPLSDEQLMDIFGTTKPTHDMVVAESRTLESLRQRYQGTYLVVYEDDAPSEIYFTGFSGD